MRVRLRSNENVKLHARQKMKTTEEMLETLLNGWRNHGDFERYINIENLQEGAPEVVAAFKRYKAAERDAVLIIKGSLREWDLY